MARPHPSAFTYELQSTIRNAPPHSGIFAIFSWETCVFVGEAANICASLLALYDAVNSCWTRAFLTHFTIELVASESRVERQEERIRELGPVCNLGVGSAHCRDCFLASGSNPGQWDRVLGPCTPCAARPDDTCGETSARSHTRVPWGSRPTRSPRGSAWEELGA